MKTIECPTCGSHEFTNNKCDYCGNVLKQEPQYKWNNQVVTKDEFDKLMEENSMNDLEKLEHEELRNKVTRRETNRWGIVIIAIFVIVALAMA